MSAATPQPPLPRIGPESESGPMPHLDRLDHYGHGLLAQPRIVVVASPSAGAEWSVVVPPGRTWLVRAVTFRLVTAVAVANRLPIVTVGDGNTAPLRLGAPNVQAASLTEDYNMIRNLGASFSAGTPQQNAQPMWRDPIPGGWTIQTSTQNLQAADQYSAISLYVVELRRHTENELRQMREQRERGAVVDNYPGLLVGS